MRPERPILAAVRTFPRLAPSAALNSGHWHPYYHYQPQRKLSPTPSLQLSAPDSQFQWGNPFHQVWVMSPVLYARKGGSKHLRFPAITAGSRLCLSPSPPNLVHSYWEGSLYMRKEMKGRPGKRINNT